MVNGNAEGQLVLDETQLLLQQRTPILDPIVKTIFGAK